MSGYPRALHSIGRLQSAIDLSSYSALLTSLKRMYHLVYITAEVIDTLDGTKVEKYQLNRIEISTYVKNVTDTLKNVSTSQDDIDLISHLITSFEANPGAWMLEGGEPENDLHSKMQRLYREVLSSDAKASLATYAPHNESIMAFNQLPHIQQMANTIKAGKKKTTKGAEVDRSAEETAEIEAYELQSQILWHQLAATRLLDHVYQLLLDKDIWYSFVGPRLKGDVTTNLERARTLKVFALYLQSLLTYYQFFATEMFLKSYELVQEWIAHFPPLSESTTRLVETTIRSHDILGARGDVDELINSFSKPQDGDLHTLVFPEEFLVKFGLTKSLRKVTDAAASYDFSGDITNLEQLDNPKYLPLTSGVAASEFDVVYDLSMLLIKDKRVSEGIREAATRLLPALTRGAAKASIDGLKALNIHCRIPFVAPHSATLSVTAGVDKGLRGGVLHLDSGAPNFSYSYHQFIRSNMKYKVMTDGQIAKSYPAWATNQVVDYDRAAHLRSVMEYQWRSLVPDTMHSGDRSYDLASLTGSRDNVRWLIEQISGMNYEIAIRQLALPHMRAVWATFLSSFSLLYVKANDTVKLAEMSKFVASGDLPDSFTLVNGHGKPYGTTYSLLESLQGIITTETQFIPLGNGLYLRLLEKIPVVTDDLRADPVPFYGQSNMLYFSSNSLVTDVKGWVFDEGLTQFSMIPVSPTHFIPQVRITPKYAFLTTNLFMNMDMYYKPMSPSPSREDVKVDVTTITWNYDQQHYFLEYKTFGPYSSGKGPDVSSTEQEMVVDAVKKIEASIKEDAAIGAKSSTEAGVATTKLAAAASSEIAATSARIQGANLDDHQEQITL